MSNGLRGGLKRSKEKARKSGTTVVDWVLAMFFVMNFSSSRGVRKYQFGWFKEVERTSDSSSGAGFLFDWVPPCVWRNCVNWSVDESKERRTVSAWKQNAAKNAWRYGALDANSVWGDQTEFLLFRAKQREFRFDGFDFLCTAVSWRLWSRLWNWRAHAATIRGPADRSHAVGACWTARIAESCV